MQSNVGPNGKQSRATRESPSFSVSITKEGKRLVEDTAGKANWRMWGPYLSERQWGTVREDYSPHGTAWDYFSHDMSRSRAYRWGEDGIAGISDDQQKLCFSLALWNGKDSIIKERFFGLTGSEGNHGEDVKECYYYLDNTPTHSFMKMLYKYPQRAFPYAWLLDENKRRGKTEPEFELIDTGVFDDDRYFDVFIEYAKADTEDMLIRITAYNRGPDNAELHLIPQLFFRNTWSWSATEQRPTLSLGAGYIRNNHNDFSSYRLYFEGDPTPLFCENETNVRRLFNINTGSYFKDGINDFLTLGDKYAVNPRHHGSKAGLRFLHHVPSGQSVTIKLRLTNRSLTDPFGEFAKEFQGRVNDAEEFYTLLSIGTWDDDAKHVQRQAYAGMLWSKQYYYYDVRSWLLGDSTQPTPPSERRKGRNRDWGHLHNADIISMPDKWEYPWYAAWDLAFHCIPLAAVDPKFAKEQLVLLTREWYMHPNGQLPAYEWAFSDVNPPVHAWATWRVYKIDKKRSGGVGDTFFLERVFQKLLLNFTWWVNKKDKHGHNIFQGGFLGLDNIGVFDRSAMLPTGGHIEQADGTAWMAMYCLNLMRMALELSITKPVYEDMASKFLEHFLYIAAAMANIGGEGVSLWDEKDEFFYDVLHLPDGELHPLRVRSLVGLIPLFAVETLEPHLLEQVPHFKKRLEWLLESRPELAKLVSRWNEPGLGERRLLSLLRGHRMKCLIKRLVDENEFLSPYGVRSVSKYHNEHPYELHLDGETYRVKYLPGESDTGIFGGNSNWRGPIWFPLNYLIIEALQRFHHYYGDEFLIECPARSGRMCTLRQIAGELGTRLNRIFLRDEQNRRPVFGANDKLQKDAHFRDYILFYEYFHGDTGRGVGASHQTGWTGLAAKLLDGGH